MSTAATQQRKQPSLDLRRYRNVVRRERWLILGCAVSVALFAASYVLGLPSIYSASASMLIAESADPQSAILDTRRSQAFYETQIEIMRARPLVESVIDELRAEGWSIRSDTLQWRRLVPEFIERWFAGFYQSRRERTIAIYYSHLDIARVDDTQIVRVRFESSDPALAAAAANAHVRAYIESTLDAQVLVAADTTAWIHERRLALGQALHRSDIGAKTTIERTDHAESGGALRVAGASSSHARLAELEAWLSEHAREYRKLSEAVQAGTSLQRVAPLLGDADVARMQAAFADAQRKVAELGKDLEPGDPAMLEAVAERDRAKEAFDEQIARAATQFRSEYEAARLEARALGQRLAPSAADESTSPELIEGTLERHLLDANRELYDVFHSSLSDAAAAKEGFLAQARVIESAVAPSMPVRPNRVLIVVGAFVATALIGLAIALFNDRHNNTLRSAREVEETLERPLLGILPLLSQRQLTRTRAGVIENSTYAEAMRTIRSGVMISNSRRPKILLVTSATSGEGKTTVALNLAAAFAKSHKVLIIEADMRQPALGRMLDLPPYDAGLSELVTRASPFKACLAKTKVSNLHVIRTGFIPEDPAALLGHRRVAKILRVLAGAYDLIVIDGPSVLPFDDAAVLAKYADAAVFVANADATPVPDIERALGQLDAINLTIAGVVLNRLDLRKAARDSHAPYGRDTHTA